MPKLANKYRFLVDKSTLLIFLLILITLIITTKNITRGDFRFSDACSHGMNGVYLHDLIKLMPLTHIYDFTLRFYGKYPAISIPYHPPFFHLVEAFFFFLFGISAVTARVAVVFFSLLAIIVWYKLIKSMYNEEIAFFSGILLITTPTIVFWTRNAMLEMPALAMIILSSYFLHTSIDLNKKGHLYYCALCLGLSMWTKQTTVFLLPLFFSYIMIKKKYAKLYNKEGILSCFILLIFSVSLMLLTFKFAKYNIVQVVSDTKYYGYTKSSASNFLFYIKALPSILTIPLLVLSCLSIAAILLKKSQKKRSFFLLWIFWAYAIITYTSVKGVRYAYFWIPPFCLFASLIYTESKLKFKGINLSVVLLLCLCIFQFVVSYRLKIPFIDGYEKAAEFVTDTLKGDTVLVGGYFYGNFIFNLRKHDPDGNLIVLRSDKVLPNPFISKDDYKKEDIYKLLEDYGTKYIVVESKDSRYNPRLKKIRNILNSSDFIFRKKIDFATNINRLKDTSILIYEFNRDVSLKKERLEIYIPKMGGKLTVPIKDF